MRRVRTRKCFAASIGERGLEPKEAARWERHFADCKPLPQNACAAGCQRGGAGATRSASSYSRPRREVSPVPVTAKPARILPRPRPSPLRWLVPALGVAAAAALWFAIRPIAPATQTVASLQREPQTVVPAAAPSTAPAARDTNSAATNSSATNSPAANSRATDSEVAQAELPPSPASLLQTAQSKTRRATM